MTHPRIPIGAGLEPAPTNPNDVKRKVRMTLLEQFKKILRSRKFWVLVTALVGTLAAFLTNEISAWQALQAALAALAVYSTGIAIEDKGYGNQQH